MRSTQERINIIKERLNENLSPSLLEVIDEGDKHKGHAGALTGLGHFAISISSPLFHHKPLIECHRLIYAALGELMQTDIHALSITIK